MSGDVRMASFASMMHHRVVVLGGSWVEQFYGRTVGQQVGLTGDFKLGIQRTPLELVDDLCLFFHGQFLPCFIP